MEGAAGNSVFPSTAPGGDRSATSQPARYRRIVVAGPNVRPLRRLLYRQRVKRQFAGGSVPAHGIFRPQWAELISNPAGTVSAIFIAGSVGQRYDR